jgi:hypothetical protein
MQQYIHYDTDKEESEDEQKVYSRNLRNDKAKTQEVSMMTQAKKQLNRISTDSRDREETVNTNRILDDHQKLTKKIEEL